MGDKKDPRTIEVETTAELSMAEIDTDWLIEELERRGEYEELKKDEDGIEFFDTPAKIIKHIKTLLRLKPWSTPDQICEEIRELCKLF